MSAKTKGREPTEILADRIREVRHARGVSQRGLIERLEQFGTGMEPVTVHRIEREGRTVSVTELLQISAALNVSPVNLLLPSDEDEPVQVAPELSSPAWHIRSWIYGHGPLSPDADTREYFLAAPDTEWERHQTSRHRAVEILEDLNRSVRVAAARELPPDGRSRPASDDIRSEDATALADLVARQYVAAGERVLPLCGDLMGETEEDDRAARTLAAGLAEMLLALNRSGYGTAKLKHELRRLLDDLQDRDSEEGTR